ncbi:MAG: GatB/YqeY domain-containing protein [Actinobacteria bacterium]|nr:GatB/YqeY domain-containing protein [Actinomycetota bacterium]
MSQPESLKNRMQNDLTAAMKAGDDLAKSTIRMMLAAVMNAEVAGKEAVTLSDEQVIGVLRSESKKRLESAEVFEQAGRTELAVKERGEIAIIERYLPAAMDEAQLNAVVSEEVAKAAANGQTGPKAMGVVIKAVKERVGAGADGAAIAAAVKSAL